VAQHLQVDRRILVARESDEAYLPLLLGAHHYLSGKAGRNRLHPVRPGRDV
jgi:hypothetical protein